MDKKHVGFAVCGSFCTYWKVLPYLRELTALFDVVPIASEAVCNTDTRFGKAQDFLHEFEAICEKKIISSIHDAEPIGPRALLDLMIVAPGTGNTIAKLANGITDSTVTMACKAHLRNERPLLIAVSTNDALSANIENIGKLMQRKHIYFLPFAQDEPDVKANSLLSDFSLLKKAAFEALAGKQLQPIITQSIPE